MPFIQLVVILFFFLDEISEENLIFHGYEVRK